MTAPLKAIEGTDDLAALMHDIGRRAHGGARAGPGVAEQQEPALAAMAAAIRADARPSSPPMPKTSPTRARPARTPAFLDRLTLDRKRDRGDGRRHWRTIRAIPDPVGVVTEPGPGRTA